MRVAHLKRNYIRYSETFLYSFLEHAVDHYPTVLTDIAQNLDAFPIDCRYLLRGHEADTLVRGSGPRVLHRFLQEMRFPGCYQEMLSRQPFDLLHAHFGPAGCDALALKRALDLPLITSFYGVDASKLLRIPSIRDRYLDLFNESERIIVLGPDMAARLAAAGCPQSKIVVLHLGVDLDQFVYKKRSCAGDESVIVLFCGRLVEKKGPLDLLEAFARLESEHRNVILRYVGSGPLQKAVRERVRTLGLHSRVSLKEAVSHDQVIEEMHGAHILALPSKTGSDGDMEGTPTVLMEAQASGMPVLSTRHADISEVVRDGYSGVLVDESNVSDLTDGLDRLLCQVDDWVKMGEFGRSHIASSFNIRTQVRRLEDEYRDVLGLHA